ncbi:MAG TPA: MBL fold metallo-hydrolase [Dehalococcoidia bacterium]|nr:MBL fold metallo-hydrolase [Dehalococcoidia bacterium]
MIRRVAPGVFAIGGLKMGRAYLVEGEGRRVALIDSSSGGAAGAIVAAIEAAGHEPADLQTVVATHYHHDHTGNAGTLRERTGAALWVHAADAPYVDGRAPWMGLQGAFGVADRFGPAPYKLRVDRALEEGDTLPFGGGLRVVHAPGHTPGHIALHAPALGVLFAGDALMNVLGLRLPLAMSSHDMDMARQSVRALAEMQFEIALPGHGAPILGRASEKIAAWARAWV